MSSFNFRGITFRIKARGLERESAQDGTRLTMNYLVDWDQRQNARDALLGSVTRLVGPPPQSIPYLSRTIPHSVSYESDLLWCRSVNYRMGGGDLDPVDDQPNNTDAELRAVYEYRNYGVYEDGHVNVYDPTLFVPNEGLLGRYVSFPPQTRSKGQILKAEGVTWRWKPGASGGPNAGNPIPRTTANNIPVKETELIYTWYQVPAEYVPKSVIEQNLYRCNQTTFDDFSAGKLVFDDFSLAPTQLPDGTQGVNISYTFTFKPKGANYFPDPDDGWAFHEVDANSGSGNQPYPQTGSFAALFRPA